MFKNILFILFFVFSFNVYSTNYCNDANCMGCWYMEDSGNESDESGEGGTLTETGTIPLSTDRKAGSYSRDFERSDSEYLSHADGNSTDISGADQSLSIVARVKAESYPESGWASIVTKYETASNQRQYQLNYDYTNDVFYANVSGDGSNAQIAYGVVDPKVGVWYSLALVYNDTDLRIYINGVLDSSGSNPLAYSGGIFDGSEGFCIGNRLDSGYNDGWDGLIDDVAVFDRALSAAEVLDIHNNGLDGSGLFESEHLRPDGNTSTSWGASCTGGYTCVDEVVVQPTAGDGSVRKADKNDDGGYDQFTMTTKTLSGTCTEIVVWVYGMVENASVQPTVNIYDGTSWETAKTGTFTTSYSWKSFTWSGISWDQTKLDALQVRLTANGAIGDADEHYVDTIYADFTDTVSGGDRRIIMVE